MVIGAKVVDRIAIPIVVDPWGVVWFRALEKPERRDVDAAAGIALLHEVGV